MCHVSVVYWVFLLNLIIFITPVAVATSLVDRTSHVDPNTIWQSVVHYIGDEIKFVSLLPKEGCDVLINCCFFARKR
jgi:hypothetical protein